MHVVPGGFRITARWDFASGSRQANWLGAHVQVVEADGTRRLKPNGTPEIRTIVFPATSATMYDVWDVIGLSGTGTDSYSVENLFIPEKFTALRNELYALLHDEIRKTVSESARARDAGTDGKAS